MITSTETVDRVHLALRGLAAAIADADQHLEERVTTEGDAEFYRFGTLSFFSEGGLILTRSDLGIDLVWRDTAALRDAPE